jgi:hypothetical protein
LLFIGSLNLDPAKTRFRIGLIELLIEISNVRGKKFNKNLTKYLETIFLQNSSANPGTIQGTISNAVTGDVVSGVLVNLRKGSNVTSGDVFLSTTTDEYGNYSISNVPAGAYTIELSKDGFSTTYFNVNVFSDTTKIFNGAISPYLADNNSIRIVLTWGETPEDLDSHLMWTNDNITYEVYFDNMIVNTLNDNVSLDVDDTDSYGPETITIYKSNPNTIYHYFVYDYTNGGSDNSTALSNSNAVVRIYKGDQLIETFNVPVNHEGTTWKVFDIQQGNIVPINIMDYSYDNY